jgi:uncharacterized protein YbjT (DUF2867 family)
MKVFLTGATGFVGQEVLKQLRQADHLPRILLRDENAAARFTDIETVIGEGNYEAQYLPQEQVDAILGR